VFGGAMGGDNCGAGAAVDKDGMPAATNVAAMYGERRKEKRIPGAVKSES